MHLHPAVVATAQGHGTIYSTVLFFFFLFFQNARPFRVNFWAEREEGKEERCCDGCCRRTNTPESCAGCIHSSNQAGSGHPLTNRTRGTPRLSPSPSLLLLYLGKKGWNERNSGSIGGRLVVVAQVVPPPLTAPIRYDTRGRGDLLADGIFHFSAAARCAPAITSKVRNISLLNVGNLI